MPDWAERHLGRLPFSSGRLLPVETRAQQGGIGVDWDRTRISIGSHLCKAHSRGYAQHPVEVGRKREFDPRPGSQLTGGRRGSPPRLLPGFIVRSRDMANGRLNYFVGWMCQCQYDGVLCWPSMWMRRQGLFLKHSSATNIYKYIHADSRDVRVLPSISISISLRPSLSFSLRPSLSLFLSFPFLSFISITIREYGIGGVVAALGRQ